MGFLLNKQIFQNILTKTIVFYSERTIFGTNFFQNDWFLTKQTIFFNKVLKTIYFYLLNKQFNGTIVHRENERNRYVWNLILSFTFDQKIFSENDK